MPVWPLVSLILLSMVSCREAYIVPRRLQIRPRLALVPRLSHTAENSARIDLPHSIPLDTFLSLKVDRAVVTSMGEIMSKFDLIREDVAKVQTELSGAIAKVDKDIAKVEKDVAKVQTDIASVRLELKTDIAKVEKDVAKVQADLKMDIANVRTNLDRHESILKNVVFGSALLSGVVGLIVKFPWLLGILEKLHNWLRSG